MPEFFSNTIQAHIAALDEEAGEYKFLLLRRSADRKLYPCMWQAVTGIIEPREKAVDAAVREIGEETGLEILKLWTIPYVTTFFDPYSDRINASPVFGALTEFEREIRISEEHMDYRWATRAEAADMLILPSHIEGMDIFLKYILNRIDSDYFKYLKFGSGK